jgi:hypothetical protein
VEERTKLEQVKSGFRIVGWFFLTFFVSGVALTAEMRLFKPEAPSDRIIWTPVLLGVAALLCWSARIWWKWFVGFCCYSVVKGLITVVLGLGSNGSKAVPVSRFEFSGFVLFFGALVALGSPLIKSKLTGTESVAATVAALSVGAVLVADSPLPMVAGVIALACARALTLLRRSSPPGEAASNTA